MMKHRLMGFAGLLLLGGGLLYQAGYSRFQSPRDQIIATVSEIRNNQRCDGNKLCGYDELRFALGSPGQRLCYQYLNTVLLFMETSCLDDIELELQNQDLSQLDLARIDLRNADLSGSNLQQVNLSGAGLRLSDLSHADVSGATLEATKTLTKMDHASFRGANLRGATSMALASFKKTNFTDANLESVNFSRAHFLGTNFTRSDLRHANLSHSHFSDVQFSGAKVENLMLHQVSGLNDEIIDALRAQGAIVDRESLEAALRDGLKFPYLGWFDLSEMNLSGVDFSHIILSGTDFTGAQLKGTRFVRASLDKAVFQGADLRNADFSGSYLIHADFRGADLRGARFDGATRLETILETIKVDRTTQLPDSFSPTHQHYQTIIR